MADVRIVLALWWRPRKVACHGHRTWDENSFLESSVWIFIMKFPKCPVFEIVLVELTQIEVWQSFPPTPEFFLLGWWHECSGLSPPCSPHSDPTGVFLPLTGEGSLRLIPVLLLRGQASASIWRLKNQCSCFIQSQSMVERILCNVVKVPKCFLCPIHYVYLTDVPRHV